MTTVLLCLTLGKGKRPKDGDGLGTKALLCYKVPAVIGSGAEARLLRPLNNVSVPIV